MRVALEGQEEAQSGPFLLLVRHTSLADTVLAATFLSHPNGIGLRYILKKELLWDPCLDIVGRRLPNHFVDRSGRNTERELNAVKALARNLTGSEGVLLYPEGTRFSPGKLERALLKLRESGKAALADRAEGWERVLPPRPGGFLALLEEAPGVDVVVLAHTGFEGSAKWKDFWSGALIGKTLKLRVSRFPATEIPAGDRVGWLYERWGEMNDWVTEHAES